MQRFKFIDYMVIEVRFFKKKKKNKMENMAKMKKALFKLLHTFYITTQPILVYWLFFYTFFTLISLKVKLTSN